MMWKTGAQWSIDIIERDLSLDVIEEKERRAPDDDGAEQQMWASSINYRTLNPIFSSL